MQEMFTKLSDLKTRHQWPISFSIGLVTTSKAEGSLDLIVELADKAMYEIKKSTKNGIRTVEFTAH